MIVEPISESVEHPTTFEREVRFGQVEVVASVARRGWRVRLGDEEHRITFPVMKSGVFVADGATLPMPRGIRRRSSERFGIGSHSATIERWMAFEPIRHWLWGSGLGRATLTGAIGAIFSTAIGAGVVASQLGSRRSREFIELLVDGRSAGTWIHTFAEDRRLWEFVAADSSVEAVSKSWDAPTFLGRTTSDDNETLDDAGLAVWLRRLVDDTEARWTELEPDGPRAWTVSFDRERSSDGNPLLVAKIPHGPGQRRSPLVQEGWRVEADAERGTRYYVRRFGAPSEQALDAVVGGLREAYRAVYAERMRFDRWKLRSGPIERFKLPI